MKRIIILFLFFFFSVPGLSITAENNRSYLTCHYFLAISIAGEKEIQIPLKVLNKKPILATLDTDTPFILTDGIYCSDDGYFLEGLCRFKDMDGGEWELRLSGEPLSKKGYSVLTVNIMRKDGMKQQIDFTFKGKAGDKMNVKLTPFSVIGLQTKMKRWFSIVLIIK